MLTFNTFLTLKCCSSWPCHGLIVWKTQFWLNYTLRGMLKILKKKCTERLDWNLSHTAELIAPRKPAGWWESSRSTSQMSTQSDQKANCDLLLWVMTVINSHMRNMLFIKALRCARGISICYTWQNKILCKTPQCKGLKDEEYRWQSVIRIK